MDRRLEIVKQLLHWLIHNGSLPAAVVVHPSWVASVELLFDDLELEIEVRGSFGVRDDQVRLEA